MVLLISLINEPDKLSIYKIGHHIQENVVKKQAKERDRQYLAETVQYGKCQRVMRKYWHMLRR